MSRRAAGEGTLYFDAKRRRWVAQASAGLNPATGKRRRLKVTGAVGESKVDVARRLAARVEEAEGLPAAAPRTVGDLVEAWIARAAPKRMSPRTLRMVESMVRLHLLPVLGATRLRGLTAEQVEQWLDAKAEVLARSSVVKLRSYLAQAFDFGMRRRHVSWNPARAAEIPATAEGRRTGRALTAPEARALLRVADEHRLGAWVTVTLTLGLRPGETSGLTWEAINLDDAIVTVYQSMGWGLDGPALKGTKTGRSRTLALPVVAVTALRRHRKAQAGERLLLGDRWPERWGNLVFVTTDGTPLDPSHLRRVIGSLASGAGILGTVTPYDLRHTATSLIAAAGQSAERLADLLGHVDTRMVFRHYRHPVTSSVTTAAEYWQEVEPVLAREAGLGGQTLVS